MVFKGDEMSLVDLRAVNDAYPLKGTVNITDQPLEKNAILQNYLSLGSMGTVSAFSELGAFYWR